MNIYIIFPNLYIRLLITSWHPEFRRIPPSGMGRNRAESGKWRTPVSRISLWSPGTSLAGASETKDAFDAADTFDTAGASAPVGTLRFQ